MTSLESHLSSVLRAAAGRGVRSCHDLEIVCRVELAVLGFRVLEKIPPGKRLFSGTKGPTFRGRYIDGEERIYVHAVIQKCIPASFCLDGTPIVENLPGLRRSRLRVPETDRKGIGMDSSGKIHDLRRRNISDEEARRRRCTIVPKGIYTSIVWLTRPQRRAWKELVSAGEDPKMALAKVQLGEGFEEDLGPRGIRE